MWPILQIGLAATTALTSGPIEDDPRVRAFVEAYGPLIDSVVHEAGDIVFDMAGSRIHFADGRMLEAGSLERRGECDSIFYRYSLEPLSEPPPTVGEFPTTCRDVAQVLWGRTESEIRGHTSSVRFLGRRMIVNDLLLEPLVAIELDMRLAAAEDRAIAEWIDEIEIAYSFVTRDIAGADTQSYHGWGMAFDLVPESYEGQHAYWRWSRAMDREGWHLVPVAERWSPPAAAVQIFERHGFVWGGKWAYFDMIHFEYRPEIVLYNRLIEGR
jgi:hypothetical protein